MSPDKMAFFTGYLNERCCEPRHRDGINLFHNVLMMMFVTHRFNHESLRWHRAGLRLAALLIWFGFGANASAQPLSAAPAEVLRIEPMVLDGQLSMNIDTQLTLNSTMRQALNRGLPLFFSIEVEINQPRWWWFDKDLVDTHLTRRLSFNNLTQQWLISTGDLSVTFTSFEQAQAALRRVRNWPVALSDRFNPDTTFEGRVRIRLDTTQLARPLQLDPANRNEWTLSSPWKAFEFMIRRPTKGAP
jgi:hypothetical protein